MRAFSLVELSIVLVILGLLTGGILAGQSLVRAAELRAVSAQYQRYSTAAHAFRDKYMSLPGDMPDATRFWGRYAAGSGCASPSGATVATPGACDGNGDGIVAETGAAGEAGEVFQFWRHLALAGMIEGDYSGLAGTVRRTDHDAGVNCPTGPLAQSIWGVIRLNNETGADTAKFAIDYVNSFVIGYDDDNNRADGRIMTPSEAWNIDTKLDDGQPAQGKVIGYFTDVADTSCAIGGGNTDFQSRYDLTKTEKLCGLFFLKAF